LKQHRSTTEQLPENNDQDSRYWNDMTVIILARLQII
jgi:hypothetical protein